MENEHPYITEFRAYSNIVLQGIEEANDSLLDIKRLGIKLRSQGVEFTRADREAIEVIVAKLANKISRMSNIVNGVEIWKMN